MHPEFPPIAFIAACSVLFVIPWHWRAGNVATLSIAFWLFITNVIYGVDAVIWGNNVRIVVPVWCDITTKFLIGANVALPAASLCVCIHLEQVASIRRVQSTFSDKRRRQIIELIVCFGLPTLIMALHYIVQGHRFDIIEEYGCRPTTYFSVLAIFIQYIPPLVLSAASMVYSALALRHFMLRRISFAAHLQNSNSALTTSRYLRLMLMAVVQMLWSAIVTSYTLWFTTISIPIRSWTNWADVHSDWLRIDLYSTLFTPPIVIETYYILWWTIPASTIIFVGFFAFGRDALDEYKKCFAWFRTRVLRRGAASKPAKGFMKVFTVSSPSKRASASIESAMSTKSSLPSYCTPSPSPPKIRSSRDDINYDSNSDISHRGSESTSTYGHKSQGLVPHTDLPATPSTLNSTPTTATWSAPEVLDIVPLSPPPLPSPVTPPPLSHARIPGGIRTLALPRPFTFPSHSASHRAITDIA